MRHASHHPRLGHAPPLHQLVRGAVRVRCRPPVCILISSHCRSVPEMGVEQPQEKWLKLVAHILGGVEGKGGKAAGGRPGYGDGWGAAFRKGPVG